MSGRAPTLDVLAGDRLGKRGIRLDLDRSRVVHGFVPFGWLVSWLVSWLVD